MTGRMKEPYKKISRLLSSIIFFPHPSCIFLFASSFLPFPIFVDIIEQEQKRSRKEYEREEDEERSWERKETNGLILFRLEKSFLSGTDERKWTWGQPKKSAEKRKDSWKETSSWTWLSLCSFPCLYIWFLRLYLSFLWSLSFLFIKTQVSHKKSNRCKNTDVFFPLLVMGYCMKYFLFLSQYRLVYLKGLFMPVLSFPLLSFSLLSCSSSQ